MIPELAGTLRPTGAGGGFRLDLDTVGAYIPEVARALNAERDGYNDGSDQTYVPEVAYAMHGAEARGVVRNEEMTVIADTLVAGAHPGGHNGQDDTKTGHLVVASLQDGRALDKRQNGLGVSDGKVAYTMDGTGAQAVAYRKATKAHSADDAERWQEDEVVDTLAATGMSRSAEAVVRGGAAPMLFGFNATRGANNDLALSEDHAPPITGSHGDPTAVGPVEGLSVRRLTPTECERLQGFPDGWTAGQSDSVRYRQLGNAVCVPVAEWIGRRLPPHA